MKPGQKVIFSGRFFQGSDSDCLSESSLTLRGKLRQPEFIFRFADLRDYEQTRSQWASQQTSPTPVPSPPTTAQTPTVKQSASSQPAPHHAQPVIAAVPAAAPATIGSNAVGGELMLCDTTKHAITIDRDPTTNFVRYRSWNRPKDKSEEPDMQVQPGEVLVAGTGPCRSTTYRFKTGNTGFDVANDVNCVEGTPPANAVGQLTVQIGGEIKSEYWCLR